MGGQAANTNRIGRQLTLLVVAVIAILSTVSFASQWYAREFAMPRYCGDPERYILRVEEIITDRELLKNDSRRKYLVAAKLNYLAPRNPGESLDTYLERLRKQLQESCSL